MKMISDCNWSFFDCTAQAEDTLNKIIDQIGVDKREAFVAEVYGEPFDADEVADDLHHEWQWIFDRLGVKDDEDEEDDEENENEEE